MLFCHLLYNVYILWGGRWGQLFSEQIIFYSKYIIIFYLSSSWGNKIIEFKMRCTPAGS